jgi:hypothetical protein
VPRSEHAYWKHHMRLALCFVVVFVLAACASARVPGHAHPTPDTKRFLLPTLPKIAPRTVVKPILAELAIPPLFDDDRSQLAKLPFAEDALKNFAVDASLDEIFKDVEQYPLRIATLRALQTIRATWPLSGKARKLPTTLNAPINDQTKRTVTAAQESLAIAIVQLEVELDNLKGIAQKRATETKRWQAHYDFTIAEVRLRLVVLEEYNRALAHVRTETLPDLPAGATGWRLVPSDKLAGKRDIQKLFAEATDCFDQMVTTYTRTPWGVLARRSLAALPSARWEAVVPSKDEK